MIRGRSGAPAAVWKRRRFSSTFSRVSQSVKPRLRTFSLLREETRPGRVLKAWISQGRLERAGIWRSWSPGETSELREGGAGRLRVRRFPGFDFVDGIQA